MKKTLFETNVTTNETYLVMAYYSNKHWNFASPSYNVHLYHSHRNQGHLPITHDQHNYDYTTCHPGIHVGSYDANYVNGHWEDPGVSDAQGSNIIHEVSDVLVM